MCGQNNRQSQQEPVRHRTLIAQVIQAKTTPARRRLHGLHCRSVTFRCVNCLKVDPAPATFLNMLRYKAAEAGAEFLEADTRRLKPSQRCPDCGSLRKKALSERQHDCACGCSLGRDEAAALVLLRWGLEEQARRRALPDPPEDGHPAGTVGVSAAQAA